MKTQSWILIVTIFLSPLSLQAGKTKKKAPLVVHRSSIYEWGTDYDQNGHPICYYNEKVDNEFVTKMVAHKHCAEVISPIYLWGDEFHDIAGEITDELVCYQLTPNKLILQRNVSSDLCIAFHGQEHVWGKKGNCLRYEVTLDEVHHTYHKKEKQDDGSIEDIVVIDNEQVNAWKVNYQGKRFLVDKNVDPKFCRRENPGLIRWNVEKRQCERVSDVDDRLFEVLDKTACLEMVVDNVCPVVPYMTIPYVEHLVEDILSNVPKFTTNHHQQQKIHQGVLDVLAHKVEKHQEVLNKKIDLEKDEDEDILAEDFDQKLIKAVYKNKATIDPIVDKAFQQRKMKADRKKMIKQAKKNFMKAFDLNDLKHQKVDQEKIFQSIISDVKDIKDESEKQKKIAELITHYVSKYSSTFWGGKISSDKQKKMIELLNIYLSLQ